MYADRPLLCLPCICPACFHQMISFVIHVTKVRSLLLKLCEDMMCRLLVLYIQTLSEGSSVLR